MGPLTESLSGSPSTDMSGNAKLPGNFCGCGRHAVSPRARISPARSAASNCTGNWTKGTLSFIARRSIRPIEFTALLAEFACLLGHAFVQDFRFAEAMLARVVAHVLGDLHRTELRPAHRAEMRALVRVLGQRLVVEFLRLLRIQREIELVLPA